MTNKELVIGFLKALEANKVREAYQQFIASDFIHHNQYFNGDRDSLMLAMEEAHKQNPDTRVDIKQIFEDGDTVIVHSHVKHKPDELGYVVVHIFKFRGSKVVELWDLGQEIISDSPNENGLF